MPSLTKTQICELIPHRDPFLWLDEVVDVSETTIRARKLVSPELDVFRGHYPGQPVLPGVLLCEAAMQAGAVLIARQLAGEIPAGHVPVATRINNVKFRHMVRPGDILDIQVTFTERLGQAYFMTAKVAVSGKTAAHLDFACTVTAAE